MQDFYNPISAFVGLQENVFYTYFPNVLLDLAAALAAMVLVDSNKEVVVRPDTSVPVLFHDKHLPDPLRAFQVLCKQKKLI